jgi:hypothetical protein
MAGKYPQPPGDEGSRKNLANRKGKVDRVEKAYVGIVNVYSLIPKGGGAVKIEEFNIPPAPSGAKIYPQSKPPAISSAEKKKIAKELQSITDKKVMAGLESLELVENKNAKVMQLRRYVGGKGAEWIKDIGVYEQWLLDHPRKENQFHYTLESDQVKSALRELRKVEKTKRFESILNRQAMNLSVSRGRLLDWYRSYKFNPDKVIATANKRERELIAHKEAEAKLKAKTPLPDTINIDNIPTREIPITTKKELPVRIEGLRRISFSESNDSRKYLPLAPGQIEGAYKADPTHVVTTQDANGNISYFADISSLSIERKKKLVRMNMKRPRYVYRIRKRSIKAKVIRKKILKKIKCNCRRKR